MSDALFPWKDAYKTGIRLIDGDHKGLFDAVNRIHQAYQKAGFISSAERIALIDHLLSYVKEHFNREEHLLIEYKYPKFREHKQSHTKFVLIVQAIKKINLEAPHLIDPKRLISFLGAWLENHIVKVDPEYIPYLSGGYGRRQSDVSGTVAETKSPTQDNDHDDEMVLVSLTVPRRHAETLKRCAASLQEGGEAAEVLVDLLDPVLNMTLKDAKTIAAVVLRS